MKRYMLIWAVIVGVSLTINNTGYAQVSNNTYVPSTVTIDKTKVVGEIPIQSGISPTGAVTYSVPIGIYPGVHGMQPQLAIAYNSMAGNGLLGMGWNISGLSSISRAPKNYYFDGVTDGIAMTKDDAFYLDGMRLIKLSETATQVKYQSEQGNILATANLSGTVVKYFDVFFPNGTKGTFGYTTNTGTNYFEYPLTSLSDLYSNSITYTYTYANFHYRINKISYTNAYVEFTYATRPDVIFSYMNGSKVMEDQRLQTIVCKYGSATLRTYTMGYTLQKDVSTLTSISYSAPNGSSFNPLKFYYGEGNTAKTYTQSNLSFLGNCYTFTSPDLIKATKGRFDLLTGDDGLIVTPNLNPYYQSGTKQLINKYTGTESIYFYTGINSISTYLPTTISTGAGFTDIFCANLDGQGYDEIIKVNNTVSGSNNHVVFTVYMPYSLSGIAQKYTRTFDLPSMVITDAAGNKSVQPIYYYTGDFNGDGKMEVLAVACHNPFGDTNFPSKCYLFDLESNTILFQGSIFQYNVAFEGTQYNESQAFDNSDRLFVGDFDGDGKSEIALVNTSGTWIYKFSVSGSTYAVSNSAVYTGLKRGDLLNRTLLLGEFNGDEKPDFLLSPPTTNTADLNWSLFYAMGNGQFDKMTISAASNASGVSFFLQDVNGDGKSDLLKIQNNTLYTYLSNDNILGTLDNSTSITANSVIVPFDMNGWNFNNQLIMFKDRNLSRYVYNRNDSKEHLLTGAVTSMGVVNKNNYQALYNNGSPFYTPGCCAKYPYDNFQGPLFVTESAEQYLNGTLVENPHYQYTNAVVHKQGRGFCGFQQITVLDNLRGRSVQTFDPYNFSVLKSQDSYLGLDTLSYLISVAANKIAKIQMTNKYSLDKTKNISLNHSYSNYDSYGNPQSETISYGGGITESITNSYLNNTNETGYLLGILCDQTKTTNRNGSTWTERFVAPSVSKGQPTLLYKYSNGNQTSQETFQYNTQGNPTQKSVKPYSSTNTLTTDYTYDSYGRVMSKTDPVRLKTMYEYNANGNLSQVINHKSQATNYAYDSFGRQTSASYPEGTSESVAFSWTAGGTNGLYRVQNTSSTGPATSTYYDALGRETRASQTQFTGAESHTDKLYDSYGRLQKVSLPFTGTAASYWNQYAYDSYDRPTSITEASGRVTSYSYSGNSITTTKDGIASTQTFDTQGNLTSVSDPGGTITYNMRPDGQPSSIVAPGSVTTSFGYDNYGRRLTIVDPSAGTQTWTYDAAGNIDTEKDANNKTISYKYDTYCRLITKIYPEFTANYRYNSDGLLRIDSINSTLFTSYTYDAYGRPYKVKESVVDGKWMEKTYSYSSGNLSSTQYASQTGSIVTENYSYAKGALTEIKLNGTTSIWKLNTVNDFGQPKSATTGSFNRSYDYSPYGLPTSRSAGSFQNFTYNFDATKGNLNYRKDNGRNKQEDFAYDNLNRLKTYSEYDNKGNLTYRNDVGGGVNFKYETPGKPYAISGVNINSNGMPLREQTVAYTSFKRPSSIAEGEYTAAFTYNGNGNRIKMELKKNGAKDMNRYYLSDCYEIDDRAVGGIKEKLYLGGDFYSAPAVYVKDGSGSWQVYYICRDYLGSITHITNSSGSVVQELSYDAWGRLRNPANQLAYAPDSEPELFLGRGYTGHEQLTQFGLINMNARLYDPVVGRFLSPDAYIQDPLFSQNYNRYAYCLNNPLLYTDQSGEWFGIDDLLIAGAGLIFGYVGYGISTGNWGWKAVAAGGMGAASAWLGYNTCGLSTATWAPGQGITSATTNFIGSMTINSVASQVIPPINIPISDNFGISVSPVAMMTGFKGSNLRFGVGVTASYKIGDWTLSAGTDFLNAGGRTGFGTYYGGFSYDDGENGFSFYATKYMYGANQMSGILGLHSGDFRVSFEDDLFGAVSGGGMHDRNRTAALELGYKNFSIGTQLITNDPNGEGSEKDLTYDKNKKGQWDRGYQFLSALYVGYRNKNSVVRMGLNSPLGGYLGQNWWHRHVFSTPDYKYFWDNNSPFYQMGTRQFYTLY